jgi:hypothetical protein
MTNMGLPRLTIRYTGLFDFDALYAAVIDWAKNYGYRWHEKNYKHKVPLPTGAEQEFEWEISKDVTDYIQYKIEMAVHMWDLQELEVNIDGKKKKMSKARVLITMNGTLTTDWQNRFSDSGKFGQFLGRWYEKLTNKDIGGIYGDTLMYRMQALQSLLKKYFDMQTKKNVYKGYLGDN